MKWMSKMILVVAMLAVSTQAALDVRGHWRLDDGVGLKAADSSGNGNLGTVRNGKWDQGVLNSCLRFKSGGFVNCGNDASLVPQNALTVEAWIKPWNLSYNQYPSMVTRKGSYELRFAPGGKLSILLTLNGNEVELTSRQTEWKNSVWHYVAATYDGKKIALYINGVKDSEKAASGSISESRSDLFIGSADGKSCSPGRMDEVRIAGTAFSPADIGESYDAGHYEQSRVKDKFSAYFTKKERRDPTAAVPGFLWIDAEDFDNYGGWEMDTQFVPQMGSPYLLANGLGTPVEDASTTLTVPQSGTYRLWVRTRDWLPSHSPGTFRITVGQGISKTTFGASKNEQWCWEDGGTFALKTGNTKITVQDLTGYYGRWDALILTKDLDYTPPTGLQAYKNERARLTGDDLSVDEMGDYDVIVVGAGVAGCNAAIASARTGAKTALIQDRPMLGGNNSLELGVVVSGSGFHGHKNSRESGLTEEIGRVRAFNFHGKWSQGAELVAAKEPNLTVFLNTHVNKVEKDGNTITAVGAFNMIDGTRTRYTARQFIDCTGDGWLGYYAGAEYMFGREARDTFGESNAPEKADNITMSGCLMTGHTLSYNTDKMDTPQPYTGPEWLWDLTPNTEYLEARKSYDGSYTYGRWWHENRGTVDDLWDPENARDQLIILNLSYWNWIKNHSSLKEKATNYKLRLIPIGNAKRETRRLVGDHILTQDEVLSAKLFPDRVARAGWSLDIHNPEGIFSKVGPFDFNTHAPLNSIPFRCLYSKNISNLLFAGRQVSASHVALGTVRVQGTTGVMGQAAGTAAALCVQNRTNPRGLCQNHIAELQQKLLKDDQYILDMKNEDPNDLARAARAMASSNMPGGEPENAVNGISRPVGDALNLWTSVPGDSMPQWLELKFDKPQSFNSVYLTFDTNLNVKRHASWEFLERERFVPESVRNYKLQIPDGSGWKTIVSVQNNYQRRRIHRFDSVTAKRVRVLVEKTNGDPSAKIFEIRVYSE